MIASLAMYDWPELHQANDALWAKLRDAIIARGGDAPAELSRDLGEFETWLSPQLLLSQTCGYPFATKLLGKVRYVATPIYAAEGCANGYYSSAIIVQKESRFGVDELRGKSFAYNSTLSWSGYRTMIVEKGNVEEYFGAMVESGSHRQSAGMVAHGGADVAALDAVCWHHLQSHEPEIAKRLKVVGWSGLYPALPFITSLQTSPQTINMLRQVLEAVVNASENRELCKSLAITGIKMHDPDIYLPLGCI